MGSDGKVLMVNERAMRNHVVPFFKGLGYFISTMRPLYNATASRGASD